VVPVVLSAIGVGLLLLSGYFGWSLVQTHHVGVDLTREQEALDRERELENSRRADHGQDMPRAPHTL
jgi:hypothetical protein